MDCMVRQVTHPAGDNSRLVEELGSAILPAEYGGTNGTVQQVCDMTQELSAADFVL